MCTCCRLKYDCHQQCSPFERCVLCCQSCRQNHNGHSNAVHLNDVFFAVHAALLAALTLIQCFIYERGNQRVSRVCASAIGFTIAASCISFLLVLFDNKKFPLLTFLYWLSWVKMGVTFFKYMPQVCMHAHCINIGLYDVLIHMNSVTSAHT